MNKETLEEAAEKYSKQFYYAEDSDAYSDFIQGAKWQAETSYSEEDMRQAFEWGVAHITFEEWIKKFKNK